ncbi:MAG: sigma-70 family RNA polymerase sigma factor [Ruminococcaceae bacterium]|nr:sigma-70 family RNA polymerase sigma factor [Oscillospiraceae bacterium]
MTEQNIERLFAQYADTVYRVCRAYLGNAADSEDAVQEVFLRLMRKSPSFDNESDERGWLIVTACNYCKSLLRWKKRHPLTDTNALPEQACVDEYRAELLELIMSLPDHCKQVVYMHCCEGYSLADIARLSGIKPSTVRVRWLHARRRLQELLGGMEDE